MASRTVLRRALGTALLAAVLPLLLTAPGPARATNGTYLRRWAATMDGGTPAQTLTQDQAVADAQTPENFAATIYDALDIPRGAEWHDTTGRPYPVYMAEPIRGLRG